MNGYSADNPVHEMGNAVAELYKVADMAEIIVEAVFCGNDITLQAVGNSLDVFLSQLRERIVRVEMLNGMISSRFSWVYGIQGGDMDRYCRREYEEYLSGRKEAGQEPEGAGEYSGTPAFMKLLPADKRDRLCSLLKAARAEARQQGFTEGYKAAVRRCMGNGGGCSGGA